MNAMKDFALLVSEDIKNKLDSQSRDLLRLPENREMWRECLLEIIATVSDTISGLDSDITHLRESYPDFVVDPAASIEEQKAKASRFRFHAEKRLAEVDRLIALGENVDPNLSLAAFLRDSIIEHKDLTEKLGSDPTEADKRLWARLNGALE